MLVIHMAGLPLKEGRVHICRQVVVFLCAPRPQSILCSWKTMDAQGSAFHSGYFCRGCIAVVLTKQLQTVAKENKLQ